MLDQILYAVLTDARTPRRIMGNKAVMKTPVPVRARILCVVTFFEPHVVFGPVLGPRCRYQLGANSHLADTARDSYRRENRVRYHAHSSPVAVDPKWQPLFRSVCNETFWSPVLSRVRQCAPNPASCCRTASDTLFERLNNRTVW